ncbi:cytochrome P450 [Spirillospora sp. NPDC047279]|uniref:cytochrome P450 n=1 Tax=Spirillospora sp. NPDC047279 TaxID=3155478 RepID=UPI0033C732A9
MYEGLGPVARVVLPDGQQAHLVTGYRECVKVLRDESLFARGSTGDLPTADGITPYPVTEPTLMAMDGKRHRRVRGLAGNTFGPASIDRYRPMVETLTHRLLDEMLSEPGPVELNQRLGMPLTLGIIGDVIGVPGRDLPRFATWGDLFLSAGPDGRDDNRRAMEEMVEYMAQHIGARMSSPDSAPADELMTSIAVRTAAQIAENPDEAEQIMTDAVVFAASLVIAGWETTAAAIAAFVFRLLTGRGQDGQTLYRQLCVRPDRIADAVEELLRTTPNSVFDTAQPRRARAGTELGGVRVEAGDLVIPAIDRANRDPRRFPAQERLDFENTAKPHLGFGDGPHVCMGAPLARLELNVVLEVLTRRVPSLRLHTAPHDVVWNTATTIRRPAELWVEPA